jgi:protein SCO1/2
MKRREFLLGAAALPVLASCDKFAKPVFNGVDITGAELGTDFALTDHNGRKVSLGDFRGKVVALFFGFTQCPDVCPTTLSDMAKAMKLLGPDAARVQVLFVTVDPERDTPALLKAYVPQFDPGFLGLYGDAAATAKVAKDFKIYVQKRPAGASGQYTIDHSAQTLVFDADGKLRLFLNYGMEPEKIASDLKKLLN